MHYYIFWRIVNDLSIQAKYRKLVLFLFVLAGISLFTGEIIHRQFSFRANFILYFGFLWLGIISITLSFFLISEIFRIILPSFKFYITSTSIFFSILAIIFSFFQASSMPKIKEIKLHYEELPKSLIGLKIVQLSDVHLGVLSRPSWFKKVIERVNSIEPDIIVITGDLIDSEINRLNNLKEPLKKLRAKHGVFAVTGNHEFYAGIEKFYELTDRTGIKVLDNKKVLINDYLEIIGIDDDTRRRFENNKNTLLDLFKEVNHERFTIFLSHKPKYFERAVEAGVDLQLSGHTHAGQIPPMNLIVFLTFKYPYGLYRLKNSFLYTTSGTGVWGPPMRLFSSSEIVKIVLVSNK